MAKNKLPEGYKGVEKLIKEFRDKHAKGKVLTSGQILDDGYILITATVMGNDGESGSGMALADVQEEKSVQKAESGAIRRALLTLGFESEDADEVEEKEERREEKSEKHSFRRDKDEDKGDDGKDDDKDEEDEKEEKPRSRFGNKNSDRSEKSEKKESRRNEESDGSEDDDEEQEEGKSRFKRGSRFQRS